MDLAGQINIDWDELPESFTDKYAAEIERADAEDGGIVCEIYFTYYPYQPGRFDGRPENCYPSEEASAEIGSIIITVYHQRASAALVRATLAPHIEETRAQKLRFEQLRLYEQPQGGLTMATDHLKPFDEKFLEIAHQFAADWLELNMDRVKEVLLEHGARTAKASGIETEMDELCLEITEADEIDLLGHVADWEMNRKGGNNG
jgi:hypothetical protein